jgi:hypothetical protein
MADDGQLECSLLWCWTWTSVTDASTISGMNETRTNAVRDKYYCTKMTARQMCVRLNMVKVVPKHRIVKVALNKSGFVPRHRVPTRRRVNPQNHFH